LIFDLIIFIIQDRQRHEEYTFATAAERYFTPFSRHYAARFTPAPPTDIHHDAEAAMSFSARHAVTFLRHASPRHRRKSTSAMTRRDSVAFAETPCCPPSCSCMLSTSVHNSGHTSYAITSALMTIHALRSTPLFTARCRRLRPSHALPSSTPAVLGAFAVC